MRLLQLISWIAVQTKSIIEQPIPVSTGGSGYNMVMDIGWATLIMLADDVQCMSNRRSWKAS